MNQLKLFDPIRTLVQIKQKTIKHTPTEKLYDAFISLMAGAHGLVEINTRLRTDPALQKAFGRSACAEQSVVQETLDACTTDNVTQLQQALDEIFHRQSQRVHHDFQERFLLLDVDISGLPCGRHPPLLPQKATSLDTITVEEGSWAVFWLHKMRKWSLIVSHAGQCPVDQSIAAIGASSRNNAATGRSKTRTDHYPRGCWGWDAR